MTNLPIILGSRSEGRKRVLQRMGYRFEVMAADIDEKQIRLDDPVKLTLALANAKADALLPKIKKSAILITSDQVVGLVGGLKILEKPVDEKEARKFLQSYAKSPAMTITSVVVVNTSTGRRVQGTDIATIIFEQIPNSVIEKYIDTGDPFFHAGGFDHEHELLRPYVYDIIGEPESAIGLPVRLTEKLIRSVK